MLALVLTLTLAACGTGSAQQPASGSEPVDNGQSSSAQLSGPLTVFAAASLTGAFTAMGAAFMTEHPDVSVTFNFAGSSDLATQINEGAPADVFASADTANMARLTEAGNNDSEPVVFATNQLQIIVGAGNPKGITGLADLARPDVLTVRCAPQVPCGRYSDQALDRAGLTVSARSLEPNVKGVVAKVTLGEADAGLVYRTDVAEAGDRAEGIDIPVQSNVVAEYPIVVTAEAANRPAARSFVELVASQQGQEILSRFGFGRP
jgi:molybdate transport system substrate-binding protein